MKAAKLRKTDYLTRKEEEEVIEEYSVKSLVKIFIILLVIFGIFYGITYLVVKNKKAEITEEEPYAVIDEEKITISNLLNQNKEEYYVLITKESLYNKKGSITSDYKKLYEEKINAYKQEHEDALSFYKADLDDAINKSYVGEKTNITSDMSKLKIADEVLIKVKDKKVEKYYVGHKAILDKLKRL